MTERFRCQVLHEIRNPDEYCGVPVRDMPLFTKIIKGVRKGELSIFTGSTGAGVARAFKSSLEGRGGCS
jgi:hypothetical protein